MWLVTFLCPCYTVSSDLLISFVRFLSLSASLEHSSHDAARIFGVYGLQCHLNSREVVHCVRPWSEGHCLNWNTEQRNCYFGLSSFGTKRDKVAE